MNERIPPIFVSTGTPRLAVDAEAGAEFADWARALPRPRGILVVSSQWQADALTRGSTAPRPELLHDYDTRDPYAGDLERVTYPAPGAAELAYDLSTILPVGRLQRGWDHGVWAPLVHMYPDASIPVLQLSLVAGVTARTLYGLGKRLGPLAARGYLIMGTGGITRNLVEIADAADAPPFEWARAFDGWVTNLLADAAMDELFSWRKKGPESRRAHPTPEHLDPLFVVAGAASSYEHAVGFPIRGFLHGSLSRRCVQFGR